MNTSYGLTEDQHDDGIGGVGAWKLHVVGEFVGRDPMQHKLTGVGVLALVAFQRQIEQTNTNSETANDDENEQNYPNSSNNTITSCQSPIGKVHYKSQVSEPRRPTAFVMPSVTPPFGFPQRN